MKAEDWRLAKKKPYLEGAVLQLRPWETPRPEWDHDHCEFCYAKFGVPSLAGALHQGYATPDLKYWVCPQCFADFKERFQWQ